MHVQDAAKKTKQNKKPDTSTAVKNIHLARLQTNGRVVQWNGKPFCVNGPL